MTTTRTSLYTMKDTHANSDEAPFVCVENLSKKFGTLTAVDNLNFTVNKGEIFGFLGPNGAGKTTTLNIISTLLDFDHGAVSIADFDLRRDARSVRALIGLVPQSLALQPMLTAAENVSYFAGLYGLRGRALKENVAEALSFVGLAEYAKRRAGKMSGGMQRRLNIACGLAHRPQLIVMDEPTVGVDAQSREHIVESIRTLRSRGATIIYTSHYMPEVQEICDRIAIIDHGKLVAIGTEEELISMVVDTKAITIGTALSSSLNREELLGKLKLLPDVRRVVLSEDATQLRIEVPLGFTNVSPLLRMLMDLGLQIQTLTSDLPDLETTFLALTGRELRQG